MISRPAWATECEFNDRLQSYTKKPYLKRKKMEKKVSIIIWGLSGKTEKN